MRKPFPSGRARAFRRRVKILVASALFASVGFALIRRCDSHRLPPGSDRLPFHSETWQDPASTAFVAGDITPRQKMLKDVLENVLPGKTAEEVKRLLGPSFETTHFSLSGPRLIYPLGLEREGYFGNIDTEWLLIWLDESGRIESFGIATD